MSTIVLLYIGLVLLLHIPFVQTKLGTGVASVLSDQLQTRVRVGSVNLGLLNRLIITDLDIEDQQQRPMLRAARVTASFDMLQLLTGKFEISTIQLFGAHININRKTPDAPMNCQFLLDQFKTDDHDGEPTSEADDDDEASEPAGVAFSIHSIIVRKARIHYDVVSESMKARQFSPHHLHFQDVGLTASVRHLTDDSLNVVVRRFSFAENLTGLKVENLQTSLIANAERFVVDSLRLQTRQSLLRVGPTSIPRSALANGRHEGITTSVAPSQVTPSEFSCFYPTLAVLDIPIHLEAEVKAQNNGIDIQQLDIHSQDRSIALTLSGQLSQLQKSIPHFNLSIDHLGITPSGTMQMAELLDLSEDVIRPALQAGMIQLKGTAGRGDGFAFADLDLDTESGAMVLNCEMDETKNLTAHLATTEPLDIGQIMQLEDLGTADFDLDIDASLATPDQPTGHVEGEIRAFDYKGYTYHDIHLDGQASEQTFDGRLTVNDEHAQLSFDGNLDTSEPAPRFEAWLAVKRFNPHALHLTQAYEQENYAFNLKAKTRGTDLNTLCGHVRFDSIVVTTPSQVLQLDALSVVAEETDDSQKRIDINGDFVDASFVGNVNIIDLASIVQNQLAAHLPALIKPSAASDERTAKCDFDIELTESPLLHHFVTADFWLTQPVSLTGSLKSQNRYSYIELNAPSISYNGTAYNDVALFVNGSHNFYDVNASCVRQEEDGVTRFEVNTQAFNNRLNTQLRWDRPGETPTKGKILATTQFAKEFDHLRTSIEIQPSELSFNDTTWYLTASSIDIVDKDIHCNKLKLYRDNRFLSINGKISDSPNDSIVAQLNDIQIDYVLDLVNFTAVRFGGRASGKAQIANIYKKPSMTANLRVEELSLANGVLGTGLIHAHWDDEVNGVRVDGHIFDTDKENRDRITDVHGYISPAANDIQLRIDANNTNVAFLNTFIGSVFDDIEGSAYGTLNVVGPMTEINLVGDMTTDVDLRLHATQVQYHIRREDTLHFRPYRFSFDDVHIYDNHGNHGIVNGFVSHRNVKNFGYEFKVEMENLQAYEEKQFNADKFMGTVFADGTINLKGADRHPLNIDVDITPTKGSSFAYDAATPDAIANSSFIVFKDSQADGSQATDGTDDDEEYEYSGDILMNINIHLNRDCEIKLRMDHADDGYISTFGNGNLQATYHNKGSFVLNGTYNIESGRYRLYLQDIIYRDLDIQNGSNVVFNGNPFDANIHLICWHTINSVPLIDLTSNSGYDSSSKVKVICILDITGKLDNMNLKFDLTLPNVNDETRQLVRSLISTDEEMNMQMIYLLGLGRFYTNEYARAAGDSGSSQAVNTLLSSTISGQVNQMLSNVIGTDSKWNFGTGLSTGERGWNDLDIEGILSGRLLDDRLLINGNFGYRDNALTQQGSFIGDFDVKWRIRPNGSTYLKAYNQTNDRYFTKATLNTQGIGISFQRDFETWKELVRKKMRK